MPKVSVLMPVYNAEKYLHAAIDSILSQTFADWELIIINDGSTDKSEAIITGYSDDRINYVRNETNLGLIRTLNKGITLCKGKYIARMDADDISLPERLRKQVNFLDNNPEYLMCGTNAAVIDNQNNKIGKIHNFTDNNFLKIHLLFSVPFVHPSTMIPREILEANPYNEMYKHVEDYELWCRISDQGKIANLKNDLFEYRWHDTNVSVLYNNIQEELKDKIIKNQLSKLDLYPDKDELYCHKITFRLYNVGNKQKISIDRFDNISAWFSKIIARNKDIKIYDHNSLIAFLWNRWTVLCISQNKISKILFPGFISLSPVIIFKYIKLLFSLKRK